MSSDFQLLAQWRDGDTDAGNALFARHFESLVRFFYTKVDDPEVEDLIQRTLVACVESGERFRGDASFRTYLFAVARNQLLMFWRRRGRNRIDPATHSAIDAGTSPSRAVVKAEDRALLVAALRRLPLDTQILLELHYWQTLPAGELGALFEVDPTTVRTRLHRARARLKDEIAALSDDPQARAEALGGLETWARNVRAESE